MEIQIFDCAVGDTLQISNKIKLTVIETATPSGSSLASTVTLRIDAANFILVNDKVVEEKYEVYF